MAVSGPALIQKKGAKNNYNAMPGTASSDGRHSNNMMNSKHKAGSLKNKLVHKGGVQHAATAMAQRIPLVEKPRHFGLSEAEFHALEASPNSRGNDGVNNGGMGAVTTSKLANLSNPVLGNN